MYNGQYNKWKLIADYVGDGITKEQCMKRWCYCDPNKNQYKYSGEWSEKEVMIIIIIIDIELQLTLLINNRLIN